MSNTMNFQSKLSNFYEDLKIKQVPNFIAAPLIFKLLWKKGYSIKPPLYLGIFSTFIFYSMFFSIFSIIILLFYAIIYGAILSSDVKFLYEPKFLLSYYFEMELIILIVSVLFYPINRLIVWLFRLKKWEDY